MKILITWYYEVLKAGRDKEFERSHEIFISAKPVYYEMVNLKHFIFLPLIFGVQMDVRFFFLHFPNSVDFEWLLCIRHGFVVNVEMGMRVVGGKLTWAESEMELFRKVLGNVTSCG